MREGTRFAAVVKMFQPACVQRPERASEPVRERTTWARPFAPCCSPWQLRLPRLRPEHHHPQKGSIVSTAPSDIVKELAPTGTLRVAINLGNIVLAQGTPDAPTGVTPELGRELARRLGVPVAFTTFDAAGKVFEALKAGKIDIVFLAIEPVRAAEIAFTAPYVIIEGTYVVPTGSPLKSVDEVDRAGIRVAVNKASAYDLYLTRSIKNAQLVRGECGASTNSSRASSRWWPA